MCRAALRQNLGDARATGRLSDNILLLISSAKPCILIEGLGNPVSQAVADESGLLKAINQVHLGVVQACGTTRDKPGPEGAGVVPTL